MTRKTRYYITATMRSGRCTRYEAMGRSKIRSPGCWISFSKDHSRLCKGHGAQNLAVLRHIALTLLHQEETASRDEGQAVESGVGSRVGARHRRAPGHGTAVPLLRVLTGEIGACLNAERRWNRPQGVRLRRSPPAGPAPRLIVVGLRHPPYRLNDTTTSHPATKWRRRPPPGRRPSRGDFRFEGAAFGECACPGSPTYSC